MSTAVQDPPTTIAPPQPKPEKFKIPSLKELTGGKSDPPAPPTPNNPPTDLTKVLGEPKPILPTVPTVAPIEEDEEIETQIMPAPPGSGGKKSPEQFAKERQDAKAKKLGLDEWQKKFEDATAESTRYKLELETERQAREKEKKDLEEFKKLAGNREKDIEDLNTRYFENFKPSLDPQSDPELATAQQSIFKAIGDSLPPYVPTSEGNKRIMLDNILATGSNAKGIENALVWYSQAKSEGKQDVMDLAVNSVAALLGHDGIKIQGLNDPRNQTINSDDAFFQQVEGAMQRAVPHLITKANRLQYINENAPKLAEERFTQRQKAINGELTSAFTLSQEQIAQTLQADKTDSMALFGAVLNSAPHLREMVNASIAKTSEALSSVPDQLIMPPLRSNDKVAVAQHRQMYQERRKELSDLSRYAIIGKNVGPILAAIIAERDEAVTRAEAASINTNPGDSGRGEGKPPVVEEDIPTTIMPAPPARPR